MDKMDRRAIVLALVDQLRAKGSWCGETHVQKSCYVLQTLFDLPTDFDFILYKHGPFSFDLQEYLGDLRADELVAAVPTGFAYGTSMTVTSQGKRIEDLRSGVVDKFSSKLEIVCERLGVKNVGELEKVATAIYVTEELGQQASKEDRARLLSKYKNHVKYAEAKTAIEEADALISFASISNGK